MPLPTPKKGERQDVFMSRCMRSKIIQKDFKSQKQQLAVCFSQLREKRGKSAAPKRG